MKQKLIKGEPIQEYSDRSNNIQEEIADLLGTAAFFFHFNWKAPTHDIVRRLMNEVHEFKPAAEEEP